ncbi:hypothetical protein Hanom_Chr03g00212801 [Helianthus anomalus]
MECIYYISYIMWVCNMILCIHIYRSMCTLCDECVCVLCMCVLSCVCVLIWIMYGLCMYDVCCIYRDLCHVCVC